MKTMKIVSIGLALLLSAATASAQRTEAFATGLSLGISEGQEITVLAEDRFCMISPGIAVPVAGLTHLVVVERTVDAPFPHYLPLTFAQPVLSEVWRKPLALTPDVVAIPGPGFDDKYGTSDDELVVYYGLSQPTTASQIRYPLTQGGPTFGTRLLPVGENELAWLDAGADRLWNTGDEALRILRNIGPNMQEIAVPINQGADGYLFDSGDGAYVIRSFGADGVFGTVDDEYTSFRFDPDRGQGTASTSRTNDIMMMPAIGAQWPQASRGKLVAPHPGADNRLGTADDQISVLDPGASLPSGSKGLDYRPVGLGFFSALFGAGQSGTESDGTVVLAGPGLDGSPGTNDDVIGFFGAGGATQTFTPGFALSSLANGQPFNDVMTIDGDVTLVRHYGNTPGSTAAAGVLAFFRNVNTGARVMVNHSFGEAVREILPMGRATAAFILASGEVRVAHRLDSASPVMQVLGTQVDEGDLRPVVVGPQMIVGVAGGAPGLGYHNDEFRFWRARTTMEYGAPTENAQDYAMRLRSDGTTPIVNGPSFFLTLEDAPPAEFGYCLISMDRDSVLVASGAELHLSFESMFQPYYWATLPDGTTWFPIIPPTDPLFEGEQLHFQFLIFNSASSRSFELSNGLTLQF